MSDESDQAGLILISRFLRFPYEKFLDELHSSTESLKKNLNAPRPSEHPPVRGKKCQNV